MPKPKQKGYVCETTIEIDGVEHKRKVFIPKKPKTSKVNKFIKKLNKKVYTKPS